MYVCAMFYLLELAATEGDFLGIKMGSLFFGVISMEMILSCVYKYVLHVYIQMWQLTS